MRLPLAALTLLLICCAMPAPAQDAPPAPNQVTHKEMGEWLIERVAPVYPPLARQARIQGTVVLRAVINKSGEVQDVQLISGHPMLAPAAIEAVKKWHYRPYVMNGEPADVETTVQVDFKLAGEPLPAIIGDPNGQDAAFIDSSRVRVSEGVMRGLRTEKIDAVYPQEAEQARIQGQVVLSVTIDKSGEVQSIRLISGHPMLVRSAIEAVKQWKYKPYLLNDEAVGVETMVRLSFTFPEQSGHGVVADTPMEVVIPIDAAPRNGLPQRVRVSAGVEQGLLIHKVNPVYPPDARDEHIQGTVILRATIDKEGNIADLQLISGHPALAAAAIDAVKQWKYKAFLLNGNAMMVETQIQVNFTLSQ